MTKNFLYIATVAAALASCSSNDELSSMLGGDASNLNIAVNINDKVTSKTTVSGETTSWANSDEIGITVLKLKTGTEALDLTTHKYGDDGIVNQKYTATVDGTTVTWEGNVRIASTQGNVYAYYPYAEGQTAKDITIKTTDNKDYLYGASDATVNAYSPTATITMGHAMAKITLSIVKGGYSGTGNMTEFKATSDAWATSGTLDYLNGTVTAATETTHELSISETKTLSAEATTQDFYVVAASTEAKTVTYTATIDGLNFTASITLPVIANGTHYTLPVTVGGKALELGAVNISDWVVNTEANAGNLAPTN